MHTHVAALIMLVEGGALPAIKEIIQAFVARLQAVSA
jgi:hypothetical protein